MKNIKLGITAYATATGLGNQTRAYFDHLKPYRTLVHDISSLNNQRQFPHWYDSKPGDDYNEVMFDVGFPSRETIDKFLDGLDVILVAENPLNYYIFERAKELNIKTVLVPNFEFLEFLRNPTIPKPDLFLAPSTWRIEEIKQFGETKYLHLPVDRDLITNRKTKEFTSFLHNIGNPATADRNGVLSVLAAMTIRPNPLMRVHIVAPTMEIMDKAIPIENRSNDPRIGWGLSENIENYWHMYDIGSVLVLPRRYGGNCLPMNEALAVGMPVIMTDLSPQNSFLPKEWLVPAREKETFMARTEITVYEADPHALAEKMSWFANLNAREFQIESAKADNLARSISWNTLLPEYEKTLEDLCNQ